MANPESTNIRLGHPDKKQHSLFIGAAETKTNLLRKVAKTGGFKTEVRRLGIPDKFIDHGTVEELYRECGMDRNSIIQTAKKMFGSKVLFKAM